MSTRGTYSWFGTLLLFLALSGPVLGQANPVISVTQLRNPVPQKAAAFLEKAFAGSLKESDLTTVRKSVRDPALAPFAWKAMGVRHLSQAQFAEAVPELAKAVELRSGDAESLGLSALALYGSGSAEAGDDAARKALMLDSREPAANLVEGLLLLDQKRTADSNTLARLTEYMHYASVLYPAAHLVLWSECKVLGRRKEAESHMRSFLEDAHRLSRENQERLRAWIAMHSQ